MAHCKLDTLSGVEESESSNDGFALPSFSECENIDTSEESDEISARGQIQNKRLQTSHSTIVGRRLPTRRPDPNTFNRNALMARENRRKKKEHMENLERQVDCYKSVNKKLKKLLNKQTKLVEQLKNEKKYYQSVLANKHEIINLIKAVKSAYLPRSFKDTVNCISSCGSENMCEILENGTDPLWCDTATNYISTDYNYLHTPIHDWEDKFGTMFSDVDDTTPRFQTQVSSEHNYSNSHNDENLADAGVCLHVSSGKVSLEFCASCHANASFGLDSIV